MTDTTSKKTDTPNNKPKHQFHPKAWWEMHYREWQASGLSKKQYCVDHGTTPSSFFNWVSKFEKVPAPRDTPVTSVNFIRADVRPETTSLQVTSLSVGDVRVFFGSEASASDINQWITALRSSQC